MEKIAEKKHLPLFRMIIPAFGINVFTRFARSMTSLGPIMVATMANKMEGWRVEVVDENNWSGSRDKQGLPDHRSLQQKSPATVVGFYCGLSSTIPRVWQLAEFYHIFSVVTIAGGWHAHYRPSEMLNKSIDVVVHGEGEKVIQEILNVVARDGCFFDVPGISFRDDGKQTTNPPEFSETRDLNDLPYPDFGLLRYARKIKYYPIGRIRGCDMNCEFCSVKGKPRWSDAQHLFETVNWLAETRKARRFFLVDDRAEGDLAGTIEFFEMISKRYGRRLSFTVQMRLGAAKNSVLLDVMKNAGVRVVCIGFESPIDEELKAMGKGYSSAKMLEWVKIWRGQGFRIHGMFIFGYPLKEIDGLVDLKERIRRFRRFIRQSRIDTIQILHPVPLVGTELRKRLEQEGMIFPLSVVPWDRYDGNNACFLSNDMTMEEFQKIPMKLMGRFYNFWAFIRIPFKTIAFLADCCIRGWDRWYRDWFRDILKCGGYFLIRRWRRKQEDSDFIKKLEKYQSEQSK